MTESQMSPIDSIKKIDAKNQFSILQDVFKKIFLVLDQQKYILYVSPGIDKYTHFQAADIQGMQAEYFLPEDEKSSVYKHLDLVFQGQKQTFCFSAYDNDGVLRPVEAECSRITDEQGNAYLVAVVKDISSRQITEEQLNLYKRIFTLVPDAMAFIDKNYRHQMVNPAYAMLFQQSPELLLGEALEHVLSGDAYKETILPGLEACINGANLKIASWFLLPGNTKRFLEVTATPGEDSKGKTIGIVLLLRDMTEKKLYEERITQEYSQVSHLLESSYPWVIANDQLQIIEASRSFRTLFQWEETKDLGKQVITLFDHPILEKTEYIEEYLTKKQREVSIEFEGPGKDSLKRYYKILIEKISADGRNKYIFQVHDISTEKRYEEKLKREIEEKDVIIQEIHHRVKNNLQVISSMLGIQTSVLTDQAQIDALEEAQNRIHTMALIHQYLNNSNSLSKVEMQEYTQRISYSAFEAFRKKRAGISIDIHSDPVQVPVKRAISCGLLLNEMITNSMKHGFAQKNSGKIEIGIAKKTETDLELSYLDTGKGFPSDFDFQECQSLGVKLISTISDQLGGNLTLQTGSKGVSYTLVFPIA